MFLDSDELSRTKFVSGGQGREMYIVNESGLYTDGQRVTQVSLVSYGLLVLLAWAYVVYIPLYTTVL